MDSPQIDHHTYNSRKNLWQWLAFVAVTALFILGIAIMLVGPILAFSWDDLGDRIFTIFFFTAGYPMGIWGILGCIKHIRETLAEYLNPSGMSITDDAITHDTFDPQTKTYSKGKLPFSNILKCVVAPVARETQDKTGLFGAKRYLYYPAVHFIYEEEGEKKLTPSPEMQSWLTIC